MCENCLLDPKMDFIFKRIFGSENDTDILIKFLNAILEKESYITPYDPIISVKIKNSEITKKSLEDKYSILDILATTSKGETINIEIQRKDETDMLRRMVFYSSKLISEQLESGNDYSKVNRVVSIAILNFNTKFIKNERFHNVFRLKNIATNEEVTDLQEFHFIELKKLKKCDEDDILQLFLQFLKDPNSKVVEDKSEEIVELSKARQKLKMLSRDKKTRQEYNDREKSLIEKTSLLSIAKQDGLEQGVEIGKKEGVEIGIKEGVEIGKKEGVEIGIKEGVEIGIKEGEYKAKIENAKNLLDILEDELISKKIGLPLDDVIKLRNETK